MPENKIGDHTETNVPQPEGTGPKPDTAKQPAQIVPVTDPLKALQDLQSQYDHMLIVHNEMKAKAEKRQQAEEKAKQDALKEQGKFKELFETEHAQLEAIKPKVEKYESTIKKYLESELKALPENMKALLPQGDPVDQLEWVAKAKEVGIVGPQKVLHGDKTLPPSGKPATMEDIYTSAKKP